MEKKFVHGKDYLCPICQKANINDHLSCFVAHHTNLDLLEDIEKIIFSREYSNKTIRWLIENIIIQECIFICVNCHRMLDATNYRDDVLTIFRSRKDAEIVNQFYNNLELKVDEQRKKILQLKFQLENNLLDILDLF